MIEDGETRTYTATGSVQTEDISDVSEIEIEYIDGAGGAEGSYAGGSGGRYEGGVADVLDADTLYIYVAETADDDDGGWGRYDGEDGGGLSTGGGGGSSELLADDGVIAVAHGGAGGSTNFSTGGDGARIGEGGGEALQGEPGGDGQAEERAATGGTEITGGGSSSDQDGEIRITYRVELPVYASASFSSTSSFDVDRPTRDRLTSTSMAAEASFGVTAALVYSHKPVTATFESTSAFEIVDVLRYRGSSVAFDASTHLAVRPTRYQPVAATFEGRGTLETTANVFSLGPILERLFRSTPEPYIVAEPMPRSTREPQPIQMRSTRESVTIPGEYHQDLPLETDEELRESYENTIIRLRGLTPSLYNVE